MTREESKHSGLRAQLSALNRWRKRIATGTLSYEQWVAQHDQHSSEALEANRLACAKWPLQPKMSVIMPVFDPDPRWLREAIDSVIQQTYGHWELCIADDASTNPEIRELLQATVLADSRIKLALRETNGHISRASNTALELASGEFVVWFDHDDLLSPDALFHIAAAINAHPDAAIVYSDEDKIGADGQRFSPFFKPDWCPHLGTTYHMMSHLSVMRRDLVMQAGGLRVGYEGSQDFDLALRVWELAGDQRIIHVPRVLYHWRVHERSTAHNSDAKPYAQVAMDKARAEFFQRHSLRILQQAGTGDGGWPAIRLHLWSASPRALEQFLLHTDYPPELLSERAADQPFTLYYDPRLLPRERFWLKELVRAIELFQADAAGPSLLAFGGDRRGGALTSSADGNLVRLLHRVRAGKSGYYERASQVNSVSLLEHYCLLLRHPAALPEDGKTKKAALAAAIQCLRIGQRGGRCVWVPSVLLDGPEEIARPEIRLSSAEKRQLRGIAPRGFDVDPFYNANCQSHLGAFLPSASAPRHLARLIPD